MKHLQFFGSVTSVNYIVNTGEPVTKTIIDRFGWITILGDQSLVKIQHTHRYCHTAEVYLHSRGVEYYPLSMVVVIEETNQWHPPFSLLRDSEIAMIKDGTITETDSIPDPC